MRELETTVSVRQIKASRQALPAPSLPAAEGRMHGREEMNLEAVFLKPLLRRAGTDKVHVRLQPTHGPPWENLQNHAPFSYT